MIIKKKKGVVMVNRYRMLLVIFLLSVFFIPLHHDEAMGGVPTVSEIRVADVTTRSFSVIWISNEAATASLIVYNADCSTPVISVSGESKDNNVIKATAIGLEPATTYCFQTETTSTSTSQLTTSTQQLVTTESQTTRTYDDGSSIRPFGNDLIYHPVYNANQALDSGSVLMISIDGSSYPVSTWSNYITGSNVSMPGAIVDLNNVFNLARENMNLIGSERMTLLEIRGASGCTLERWRKVPLDSELVEIKMPASCFNSADINCDDIVELGDIILDINGYGTFNGHSCFNPDLDQNDDGFVELGDIILVIGQYGTIN